MTPELLASSGQDFWWISIGVTAVVVVCIVVLLSLLLAFVNDIRRHVGEVLSWVRVGSANTAATGELARAARLIGELGEELGQHVTVLSEANRK